MGETRSDAVPSIEEALLLLLLLLFPVDPMVVLCPPLLLLVLPGDPTAILRLLSWGVLPPVLDSGCFLLSSRPLFA